MTIITAADKNFETIVKASVLQTKNSGYLTKIFSISNSLDFGIPFDTSKYNSDFILNFSSRKKDNFFDNYYCNEAKSLDLVPIGRLPYKPYIIKESLEKFNDFIVWLDADAFVIKDINEIQDSSYDIGIVIRPEKERYQTSNPILNGYTNAGVLFTNNTVNAKRFLEEWIKELPLTKFLSDQEALNRLILKNKPNYLFDKVGETFEIMDGIRIKTFSTLLYNWYYYPEKPNSNTKILHIKNNIRKNNNLELNEWFTKKW